MCILNCHSISTKQNYPLSKDQCNIIRIVDHIFEKQALLK